MSAGARPERERVRGSERGLGHPYFALPPPWLVAHRGGAALRPENTLVAFEHAAALGADAIETDVRLSRDGHVMVVHDEGTARMFGSDGTVEARTRAELEALDAGWGFTPDGGRTHPWRGRGVRVSTLAEVLARLPRTRFNVDAKSRDPRLAAALARVLEDAESRERVCVGSAHRDASRRLRELLPGWARFLPTGAAVAHVLSAWHLLPGRLCPAGFDLAALDARPLASPRRLGAVLRHFGALGIPVQLWTVDADEELARLLAAGVHGLMTDRPDRLAGLLGRAPPVTPPRGSAPASPSR